MDPVIMIGYGNALRGDDAIGPQVAPPAWLVGVSAISFGYGEELSWATRRGVVVGLHAVHDLMMRLQHAETVEERAAARLSSAADCARATPGRTI